MIRRNAVRGRDRRQVTDAQPGRPSDAVPDVTAIALLVFSVTFDQPILLVGTPVDWLAAGAPNRVIVSAQQTTPTTITVTTSAGATPTTLIIPQHSPWVRSPFGGYVVSGSYIV